MQLVRQNSNVDEGREKIQYKTQLKYNAQSCVM